MISERFANSPAASLRFGRTHLAGDSPAHTTAFTAQLLLNTSVKRILPVLLEFNNVGFVWNYRRQDVHFGGSTRAEKTAIRFEGTELTI